MINKGMGLVGVSIVVLMTIVTVIPALAVQPTQGHQGQEFGNGSESAMLNHAENLTSTLAGKGIDVSDLNGALTDAQNAIQDSNSTAFKDAMKTFNQELQADIKSGTIPTADIPLRNHQGIRMNATFTPNPAMESKELGFAQNVTSTLAGKGIDVSGLNGALTAAQNAIQNSNSTAFKVAIKTFNQELQADIKSGTISRSDLPQFSHGPLMGNRPDFSSKIHTRGTNATQSI